MIYSNAREIEFNNDEIEEIEIEETENWHSREEIATAKSGIRARSYARRLAYLNNRKN